MQLTKEKLQAQQLVLFHLGYYKGNIDGIWSQATITAKKQFEADVAFLPAYPNGGLPFGERDKLPKGMRYGVRGVIGHSDLTPERTKEIMDAHAARIAAAQQRADIANAKVATEGDVGPTGVPGVKGEDAVAEGEVNGLAGPTAEQAQAQQSQQAEQQRREQQRRDQQKHQQKGNR